MYFNVNCIYFNNEGCHSCTNRNLKKSMFGLGSRVCKDMGKFNDTCEHKVKHKRPSAPPKPPVPE